MADESTAGRRLRLRLITVQRALLDVECDQVTLPGRLGAFSVLPGHVPLMASLKVGELSYRIGRRERYLALSGGFCQVLDDVVTVLVEFAETPEEIDLERARRDLAEAESELGRTSQSELAAALERREIALVRIAVAGRR